MYNTKQIVNNVLDWSKNLFAEPIYPILFCIYPILFLYQHNIEELTIGVTAIPLATSIVITCILYIIFRLMFGNWPNAALPILFLVVALSAFEASPSIESR